MQSLTPAKPSPIGTGHLFLTRVQKSVPVIGTGHLFLTGTGHLFLT